VPDLTPERLAELRRLHEAATPGPWGTYKSLNGWHITVPPSNDPLHLGLVGNQGNDMMLCATARNALPDLLDEIDRLRELLRRARPIVQDRCLWAPDAASPVDDAAAMALLAEIDTALGVLPDGN
jgi:hypothetical protein